MTRTRPHQRAGARPPRDLTTFLEVAAYVSGVLTAAATFGVGVFRGTSSGTLSLVLAALVGVATATIMVWKSRNERKRRAFSRGQVIATNRVLTPLGTGIALLATLEPDAAGREFGKVVSKALVAAAELIGAGGIRVAYFQLRTVRDFHRSSMTAQVQTHPRSMHEFDRSLEGHQSGRRTFREGDADYGIWFTLAGDKPQLIENITTQQPLGFDLRRPRSYETFATIAVRGDETEFGVLSVSAAEPYTISEDDLATLNLMAKLIATAEAITLGPDVVALLKRARNLERMRVLESEKLS